MTPFKQKRPLSGGRFEIQVNMMFHMSARRRSARCAYACARAGGEFCILHNGKVATSPCNYSGPLTVIDRGGSSPSRLTASGVGATCVSVAAPPVAVAQLARPTCAADVLCTCLPPPSPSQRAERFGNKQTNCLSVAASPVAVAPSATSAVTYCPSVWPPAVAVAPTILRATRA